jgi:hypothetical protein
MLILPHIRKKKYMHVCTRFEEKYNMNSDEFMDKWGSGKLDDRDDLATALSSVDFLIPNF